MLADLLTKALDPVKLAKLHELMYMAYSSKCLPMRSGDATVVKKLESKEHY